MREFKQFRCPDDGIFDAIGYDNPVFYADIVANCPKCGEKCWEVNFMNEAEFREQYEGKFKPVKGFIVEEQFQEYCRRCQLDLDACSPTQAIEMRRTFYGAVGQLLIYLRDDLADGSEDDGVVELERIWQQVHTFWLRQGK